jgi:hypothetical protein
MRGAIIHWDPADGIGLLRDASGQRRPFTQAEWRSSGAPAVGGEVDFEIANGEPADIYMLAAPPSLQSPGQDEATRQATNYAIVSLVCGGVGFMIWPIGLLTAIPAILYGIRAKRLGQHLTDRSPYVMAVGGIVLGAVVGVLGLLFLALIVTILTTVALSTPR